MPSPPSYSIVSSVARIEREEWHRLFGKTSEGYDFFETLEAAKLEGFEFCYVLVSRGDRLELIAPAFWSDLDLAITLEGPIRRFLELGRRVVPRLLHARTLFCGSPFGEHGLLGIQPATGADRALLDELVRALRQICRERKLTMMVFKDFPAESCVRLGPLAAHGFWRGESLPNIVVDLPFDSMDAYLASLGPNVRKDLRRKVRHTLARGAIAVRVVEEAGDLLEAIYQLYLNTYLAGTTRFEKLTREYFLSVGRQKENPATFFLFFVQGRLACFNLCFRHGDLLIDKFIGMDYQVSRAHNLYFYTWYHNVRWCLENGVRCYQVGQTDYEAKLRLGGRPVPLYFFARHRHNLINLLLRWADRVTTPNSAGGRE